jgi:hypothetical protein
LGAVTVHFLVIMDYLAFGIFVPFPKISIPTTTDWLVEYGAAFVWALIGQLLEQTGWLGRLLDGLFGRP